MSKEGKGNRRKAEAASRKAQDASRTLEPKPKTPDDMRHGAEECIRAAKLHDIAIQAWTDVEDNDAVLKIRDHEAEAGALRDSARKLKKDADVAEAMVSAGKVCPVCHATGWCQNCQGDGCSKCGGTGGCPKCGGKGRIKSMNKSLNSNGHDLPFTPPSAEGSQMTPQDWKELNDEFEQSLDEYMKEWEESLRSAGGGRPAPSKSMNNYVVTKTKTTGRQIRQQKYTGKKRDKNGRVICFVQGKRVPCNNLKLGVGKPSAGSPENVVGGTGAARPEIADTVKRLKELHASGAHPKEMLKEIMRHSPTTNELEKIRLEMGFKLAVHGSGSNFRQRAKAVVRRVRELLSKEAEHGEEEAGAHKRGGAVRGGDEGARKPVETATQESRHEAAARDREPAAKSTRENAPRSVPRRKLERVPEELDKVNEKLGRYRAFFEERGDWKSVEYMDLLADHINNIGVASALDALGPETGKRHTAAERENKVTYWGVDPDSEIWQGNAEFYKNYLDRHGIIALEGYKADPDYPIISALGKPDKNVAASFKPEKMHYQDKLTEAKDLPGLKTSEDLGVIMGGKKPTHLNQEVTAALDKKYGAGQWVVKCYSDEAAAGYGIFFPQRAAAIAAEARNNIWTAGEHLSKYGFKLDRDPATDKIIGLAHESGDKYAFDSKEYDKTIDGDARHWADIAMESAGHEHGVELPEGDFMAQPAFPAVGISDADRAEGKTWHEKNEGRVHLVTRPDGSVEVVPHSTWLKGGDMPVVFEDEDTKAMAAAAKAAIEAIPHEARKGQVYAPDIMKTGDGYKVVELNAQGDTNGSGYLHDNAFTQDAYVSHLLGREPMHVQFIRQLLTRRQRQEKAFRALMQKRKVPSRLNVIKQTHGLDRHTGERYWDEGWDTGYDGRPKESCPYQQGDAKRIWLEGWRDGKKASREAEGYT